MGAQLLLFSFATRLHGICNGSNNGMEDGGGSTHGTALGFGISAPTPNFRVLFGTGRGNSSVFSSPTRLHEILKSHHLQARVTLAALCVCPSQPQRPHFSAVISFFCLFFIVLTASGGSCPLAPPPPLGPALYMTRKYSVPVSG